jgi:hypothetical protein
VRFVGATVVRPARVGVSGTVQDAGTDGEFFGLSQAIERAEAGRRVSVTFDLLFSGLAAGTTLRLEIQRGNLGSTTVALYNYLGDEPVLVRSVSWDGVTGDGMNSRIVRLGARGFTDAPG